MQSMEIDQMQYIPKPSTPIAYKTDSFQFVIGIKGLCVAVE